MTRRCPRFRRILAIMSMFCMFGSVASHAQSQASLNGTVKDQSGALISGADLLLTALSTGFTQTTHSNGAGVYTFPTILPGHYKLQATKDGFKTVIEPDITLDVNQTASINFALPVGTTTSDVVVSSDAIALETSTAELGAVIETREILDLPLNGRNFTELLLLTPGSSPINPLQNKGGAPGSIGAFVLPAINGQSNRSNMFLLDGINNYAAGGDAYALQPTVDDILEFKVQSHNDEAEYGQVLGGIVNLATKSGGNQFHGSAWEFFRNDALDASNYFDTSKTPLKQNQFGGAAGGPVILPHYNGHDRTFFYGSYEGFRRSTSSPTLYVTPTPAQLSGDFTAISSQIYNPYSAAPDPDNPGSYINAPFMCDGAGNALPANGNGLQAPGVACNKIPSSLFDPTMLYYAKTLFPAPKDVGTPGFNGQDNSPITLNSNQMSERIDQQLTQRDRIFFRYTQAWQTNITSGGVVGNKAINTVNSYNLGVNWTRTFQTALVQVTFGHVKGTNLSTPTFSNVPSDFLTNTSFVPNFYSHSVGGQKTTYFPTVGVDGYLGNDNFLNGGSYSDIYEIRTDDSKSFGRHQLKFGGSIATDNTINGTVGSVDVFDAINTSNGSAGAGGDAVASLLLGLPTYGEYDSVDAYLHGGKIFGIYAEDQWKVNERLTLNFGLRYDVTDWPTEGRSSDGSDITGNMNLNNGTYVLQKSAPACSATQSYPCIPGGTLPDHVVVSPNGKIIQNTYDNVQPRFGIAYRINDKTVFRAAYGRFFDNWAAVVGFAANFTESWPNAAYLSGSNLNIPLVNAKATDPLMMGAGPITPAPTPFDQSDGFLDPNLKNPHSDQYNLGFQREWWHGSILTVNYVGSQNRREMLQLTGNAATTPGPGDPQLRAPFTYIQPQNGYVKSIGSSNYNALQISSTGRSGGLTHKIVYTYSKSLNYGCDTYSNFCDVQDPYDISGDYGPAGWNLKHIFAASAVYDLPFGMQRRFSSGNRGIDYLIGGWQVNALVSLHNGSPYDVQAPYQIPNTNNISGAERANLVGKPYAGGTKLNPINVNAFALPDPYTFGNMGRNSLVTDWGRNLDMSIFRSFPIREAMRFEFRAEAFNLTNTPVFAQPDNNITDPNFGAVSATQNTQRELQMALKFYF